MITPIEYTPETVIEMGQCYIGMPNSVYHSQEGISKSSLDRFADSPYKYFYGKPIKQTKAMVVGSATHAFVVEHDVFYKTFMVEPKFDDCLSTDAAMKAWLKERGQTGYSTKKGSELIDLCYRCDPELKFEAIERKKWEEYIGIESIMKSDHEDAIFGVKTAIKSDGEHAYILSEDTFESVEGMKKALLSNSAARKYLKAEGFTEISFFTTDPITGIKIRIRFDKLAFIDGQWYGFDLKKTQSIKWRDTSNTLAKYRYHVQAAFYSYVFKLVTGIELAGFIFGFVEEEFPHVVAVGPLDDLSFNIGCEVFRADLNLYAEYKRGDIVAHNDEDETIFSLPDYFLREFEQEII